ncbi:hypothetical protein [Thermomonas sp. LB-4]
MASVIWARGRGKPAVFAAKPMPGPRQKAACASLTSKNLFIYKQMG